MSKENAFRFMLIKSKDEKIKSAYDAVLSKYQGKNLSDDERDSVLEEISQLAKKYGFDFTPEDFTELQKTADGKLPDEELDEVVGGRGQFSVTKTPGILDGPRTVTETTYCDYAPDDQTFIRRYNAWPDNNCPDYTYAGQGPYSRCCASCANCHFNSERGPNFFL